MRFGYVLSLKGKDCSCKLNLDLLLKLFACFTTASFASLFGEIFFEEMMDRTVGLLTGVVSIGALARVIIIFVCIFVFCWFAIKKDWKVFPWIFKYRYLLAFAVLVFGILLELSGSSIGIWSNSTGGQDTGTIFGIDRAIRSDEWKVLTPFFLSQELNNYSVISDIIRGGDTLTSIVYALPSWSLATVFHPFLVGFLFLGSAKGLSFFWIGRFVVLFLVTFECARLFTRDNRCLSAAFAILVSFAPIVQWWFAVNGIAEILIFGQLLVIILDKFLRTKLLFAKWVYAFSIAWFAGCYLLVFYPALQVPCFYIFALMGIWVGINYIRDRRKNDPLDNKAYAKWFQDIKIFQKESSSVVVTIASLAVSICLVSICIVLVFIEGWDAVSATLNSAYPGNRISTGGGFGVGLFYQASALLLPIMGSSALPNVCEHASFYSFFPLGSLLALFSILRKRDILSTCLLVLQMFMIVYMVIGVPEWLATLTLFKYSTVGRVMFAVGLVESVLLLRGLVLNRDILSNFYLKKPLVVFVIVLVLGISITLFEVFFDTGFTFSAIGILLSFLGILSVVLGLLCWISAEKNMHKMIVLALTFTVALSGFCINPIHKGIDYIQSNQVIQEFQQVVDTDKDGLWLSCDSLYSQLLVMAGAKTLNSVSVYPNIDLWSTIDRGHQFEDVYNRYAHIDVIVIPGQEKSYFELVQADFFKVHLSVNDFDALEVNFIFSDQNLESLSTDEVQFEAIGSTVAGTIYKVNYFK